MRPDEAVTSLEGMGPDPKSYDLLAHFDRPKTVDSPDFEWVDEVIPNEQAVVLTHHFAPPEPPNESFEARRFETPVATQRGVQWVLQWAAALAVLAFAGSTLIKFAYLSVAEHKLSIAARAGVLEATLPRASYQSVAAGRRKPSDAVPEARPASAAHVSAKRLVRRTRKFVQATAIVSRLHSPRRPARCCPTGCESSRSGVATLRF